MTIAEDSGGRHLGLVEWLDQHEGRWRRDRLDPRRLARRVCRRPFTSVTANHSDPEVLADFYRDASAVLGLGSMAPPRRARGAGPEAPDRHTFWCGQSGSGKTFALGVALEQILMLTRLPVAIFDPTATSSDWRTASRGRRGRAHRLGGRDIRVLRPATARDGLRIRFRDMSDPLERGDLPAGPTHRPRGLQRARAMGAADARLGPAGRSGRAAVR